MTNKHSIFSKTYFSLLTLFLFFSPAQALAYDFAKDSGLNATAQGTGHAGMSLFSTANPLGVVGVVIGVLLSLLGVVFLVLIIYGGFLWMTASGNEEKVTKAKKIIQNSIVGLIIVMAAYAITTFIGSQLT